MSSLLIEYRPFVLKERLQSTSGLLRVKGVLQRAEAKNQNGRVYPKEVLVREAKSYLDEAVKQNRAMGELDHPDSSTVSLANTSHVIKDMWWEGDDLLGVVEILDTPAGRILKSLFESNVTVGISSRGVGSVKEVYTEGNGSAMEVQEDFKLIAFDFVSDPSVHNAFMKPVKESKENTSNSASKINNTINQIIQDSVGLGLSK